MLTLSHSGSPRERTLHGFKSCLKYPLKLNQLNPIPPLTKRLEKKKHDEGKTEMMMQTSGPGSKMNVDSIEADKRKEMRNELSIKTSKKKKSKKR